MLPIANNAVSSECMCACACNECHVLLVVSFLTGFTRVQVHDIERQKADVS